MTMAEFQWCMITARFPKVERPIANMVHVPPTSRRPTGRQGRAGLPLALPQGRLPIKLPLLLGGGRDIGGG